MKRVAFFEIPVVDFNRAVKFYETILGIKLNVADYGAEKMAFFPEEEEGKCHGSISSTKDLKPSKNGVLIHYDVEDIETTLVAIAKSGGKVILPKTKIEAVNCY
jgi:predicted enzyme related to lactoylglutathione lyase